METYDIGNHHLISKPKAMLGKMIAQILPEGLNQVMFNNMDEMEKAVGSNTAAVILETIPATMGMVTPVEDYLKRVKEICEKNASLLILDEVQTGFGRTGRFWGFENYDVRPDMIVMGKGMSGGIYPVSATVYHFKDKVPLNDKVLGGEKKKSSPPASARNLVV